MKQPRSSLCHARQGHQNLLPLISSLEKPGHDGSRKQHSLTQVSKLPLTESFIVQKLISMLFSFSCLSVVLLFHPFHFLS